MSPVKAPDELAEIRARTIGFVFQTFNLLPVLSAEENVEYPLLQMPEISKEERRERVTPTWTSSGSAYAHPSPNQLSGGQRQRVAIARALVTNSRSLPTSPPPTSTARRAGILDLMQKINVERGTTFFFSTHKLAGDGPGRSTQVRMEDGRITKLGSRPRWPGASSRPGKGEEAGGGNPGPDGHRGETPRKMDWSKPNFRRGSGVFDGGCALRRGQAADDELGLDESAEGAARTTGILQFDVARTYARPEHWSMARARAELSHRRDSQG